MIDTKFKNKYRIETTRLENWDYSKNGIYFITILTKDRIQYFGKITDGKMIKNNIGEIAEKYWVEITNHFTNIILDEFIIMPNHIHGIIIIKNNSVVLENITTNNFYSEISPKSNSISSVIRSYKSICTKIINSIQNDVFFSWHSRFYDKIIKNETEFKNIKEYIINNPKNFSDKENEIYCW